MIKELIEQQRGLPPSDTLRFPEYISQSIQTFDTLVDFLRDPQRFPNKDVNELITLGWQLIGNKTTPVVLDQFGVKSLSFAVLDNKATQTAIIIMPTNFMDLVREDPVMQMGAVAFVASQCRDFHTGRITKDGSRVVEQRARAFEAETYRTLEQIATQEGIGTQWNPYQKAVLAEFPQGLKDLDSSLIYPTPPFEK